MIAKCIPYSPIREGFIGRLFRNQICYELQIGKKRSGRQLCFDPETKLLENLVAIDLKKKYGDDLFFYHRNVEVDFFIPKERRAIQVSYNIENDITRQREINALIKLSEVYNLEKLEIVTFDQEETIQENDVTIRVVPIWKWLI